jgi:hypothetical protein
MDAGLREWDRMHRVPNAKQSGRFFFPPSCAKGWRVLHSVFKNLTGTKEFGRILQNLEKINEIQENLTEMCLMSERNRNFLKTQKSAEFAELLADSANNSAK